MSLPTDEIFIQIASYRDPDLVPTVRDCIDKADDPDRLTFGLCWQHGEDESIDDLLGDPRIRVIAVPHNRSRGVCWARSQLQALYDGEEYTLQLDSHHRFVEGWDSELVAMLTGLRDAGHEKPIITGYAPHFDPLDPEYVPATEPLQLVFDHFIPEGSFFIRPEVIPDHGGLDRPVPARFYSAHFAFTVGRFVAEVPHDPELYFTGEEPMISVRAFTHGYDLFHPHKVLLWHHYTRPGEPRHWEDDPKWVALNALSYRRQRQLLELDPGGPPRGADPLGMGDVRSLADYQEYAGIDFARCAVAPETLAGAPPPTPLESTDHPWVEPPATRQEFTIEVDPEALPTADDIDFWFVGAHDADDNELFRQDLKGRELEIFLEKAPHRRTYSFQSTTVPASWTVWPHSVSSGWLTRLTKTIDAPTE